MNDGMELVVIGVIVVIFLLYGPSKISEFARASGNAKREFQEGEKGA